MERDTLNKPRWFFTRKVVFAPLFFGLIGLCLCVGSCDKVRNSSNTTQTIEVNKEENIENINDTITQNFYVFSANFDKDDFSKEELCGYLLFEDRGSPFDYHDSFVWAENLPEEYQKHLLPVIVSFNYTGEMCSNYSIINIVKIQKQ